MRLKKSKNAAEELISCLTEGYQIVDRQNDRFTDLMTLDPDNESQHIANIAIYDGEIESWGRNLKNVLSGIFPTELEWLNLCYPTRPQRTYYSSGGIANKYENEWHKRLHTIQDTLDILKSIFYQGLNRYTDLPEQLRLYIQDIDSFRKVRDTNSEMVNPYLRNGYFDYPEDFIQIAIEKIIDEPFHKKDWGGETNDLYTSNILLNGSRITAAFLLKGNGLGNKKSIMEISDCGKNGDQIVRLFEAPAQLFIVQYVGHIAENLIKDVEGKVKERRARGENACYCIINGQDTAQLLYAYKELPPIEIPH